jgi:hypothetical protein
MTLQNHNSISYLIEFYLKQTKDFHNENLNDLIINNRISILKLNNNK